MEILVLASFIFLGGYLINIFYITVFYHRGLAHRALVLTPGVEKWVVKTGSWVTGIDPKAWVCMHRLHHQHSDTELDPHSPVQYGVFGVAIGQLKSYERVLRGLIKKEEYYTKVVSDLKFDVNPLNRNHLWALPYFLHFVIALSLGSFFAAPLIGFAYFLGIMSHPIQGWMVNSLAHHSGYKNFESDDNSRNNTLVALLVFGEGYQNNHHARPSQAHFAMRPGEIDLGYYLCQALLYFRLARLSKPSLEEASSILRKSIH